MRRYWPLLAFLIGLAAAPRLYATLTYIAAETENFFAAPNHFASTVDAVEYLGSGADSGPKFPAVTSWDNAFAPTSGTKIASVTVTGAIADPVDAPILSATTGGSLPADTYHISFGWVGRFGTQANGATAGSMVNVALTKPGPAATITISGSQTNIQVNLPDPYPVGATGWRIYAKRDGGPAATNYTNVSVAYPGTLGQIINTIWPINAVATVNNTADLVAYEADANGWTRSGQQAGISAPMLFRTQPTGLFQTGPPLEYSYDGGTTVYRLREPRFSIPVCGTNPTIASVLAAMDGVHLPLPAQGAGVGLLQVGACGAESVTWRSYLTLRGRGLQGVEDANTTTIDLTGVTGAAITNFTGFLNLTGSSASSITIAGSTIIAAVLTNSEDVTFVGNKTGGNTGLSVNCGALILNGGSYSILDNDFTCPPGSGLFLPGTGSQVPVEIGSEGGTTPVTVAQITGNVMRKTTRTDGGYYGWLRGFFDATVPSSVVQITGNDIYLDNGDSTACIGDAPGQGSLIAFNTGLSGPSTGSVRVEMSGNTLHERSCQKAIILRTTQLDHATSSLHAVGNVMYAETTGTGTTGGVDADAHCWEGAPGVPQPVLFEGGSCTVVNNANGEARPFYTHEGCCFAGEHPEIFIQDYYIEADSTKNPVTSTGFGVVNGCDTTSPCDMRLRNVVVRHTFADTSQYHDLGVETAAFALGSTMTLEAVDFDPTLTLGSPYTRRGIIPLASAPAHCKVGDTHTRTNGAFCVCTATDTFTNAVGTGTCS